MCPANFPKEIPFACLTTLATQIKDGASKGDLLQTIGQIVGQTGALLTPSGSLVGASGEPDRTLSNLANELLDLVPPEPEEGKTMAVSPAVLELILPLVLRIIQRLLTK